MVSHAELILRVITLWFLVLSQFFRDGMGPFNIGKPLPCSLKVLYMPIKRGDFFHYATVFYLNN